jgi:hypothetical protein
VSFFAARARRASVAGLLLLIRGFGGALFLAFLFEPALVLGLPSFEVGG